MTMCCFDLPPQAFVNKELDQHHPILVTHHNQPFPYPILLVFVEDSGGTSRLRKGLKYLHWLDAQFTSYKTRLRTQGGNAGMRHKLL
jgi:hypothetical protein